MRDKFHHRGHRENREVVERIFVRALRLCVLCGKSFFVLILAGLFTSTLQAQRQQPQAKEPRTRYQIHLSLDFENRTYTGTERVRWINRGDRPTSALFFHLYPNVRIPGYTAP